MRYIRAFGQFWYDFIIGDDWKIAVAVVLGLLVTASLVLLGLPDAVISLGGTCTIIICWLSAVVIDQHQY